VEAARLAIEDAGLRREDIDGCINGGFEAGAEVRANWSDTFPRVLGLPTKFYFTVARGAAVVPLSIISATQMLNLGLANYIIVAYGATDWSLTRDRMAGIPEHKVERSGLWGRFYGDITAPSHHSFFMSRHMHEFGTTTEQIGAVAVQQRRWANLNPDAYLYNRPLTLEDYLNSPYIIEPYRVLDMCQISDAGAAFIITTAERARDLRKPPVYVLGLGFGEMTRQLWWEKANYTRMDVEVAQKAAFEQAGLSLADVDLAQLYDCFTGEVILQIEDYGWCAKGEGGPFIAAGNTGPGGSIPVNTGGGVLASYYIVDFTLLLESVTQLRHEAGERQVKDAKVGLMSGHGGEMLRPGMCSIHATTLLGR
jgi:acetyl-CoA acetyltransferase